MLVRKSPPMWRKLPDFRAEKTQIFAENQQETADFRRKLQIFAGNPFVSEPPTWGRQKRVTRFVPICVQFSFPKFIIDLSLGLFRGAVFDHGGMPQNCPLTLMGRLNFPSLMGRFPTLTGRFPQCLSGPFSLLRIPWKTAR